MVKSVDIMEMFGVLVVKSEDIVVSFEDAVLILEGVMGNSVCVMLSFDDIGVTLDMGVVWVSITIGLETKVCL